MDLVPCNPHTLKNDQLAKNPNPHLAIARHEIHTSLQEVVTVSADLLKQMVASQWFIVRSFPGYFTCHGKRQYCAEKARFVYPKPGKEANVLLIEGIKQGKKTVFVCYHLFTYNEKNEYEAEMKAMLYGE